MTGTDGVTASELMTLVQAWRRDPSKPVPCPACQAQGLAIVDQSARPYREWYAASCPKCGFEKTVAISLGSMGG